MARYSSIIGQTLYNMKTSLRSLRPVGNPIKLRKEPLDYTQFGNFHLDFYHSGTAALAASISAIKSLWLNEDASPEIILPAYACPDLISAILYAGATPVLVDLEPDSCWMSLEQIEQRITKLTIAIIAVRFLGIAERMQQLHELCKKYQLTLIEDSAQGFPLTRPDNYWLGDVIILSFGRGKPVNMLGGGAVLTKIDAIKDNLPASSSHADTLSEQLIYIIKVQIYNYVINPAVYGITHKLPGFNIGETIFKPLNQLSGIHDSITERLNFNIKYFKKLPNRLLDIKNKIELLKSMKIVNLPSVTQHDFENPLLRYPILVKNQEIRDALHEKLTPLGSSIMYQKPLYQIKGVPAVPNRGQTAYINAESFADRLITLPTHKDVSNRILEEIFARLREV